MFDDPIEDPEMHQKAKEIHNDLKEIFKFLNPDIFNEDPNIFLGDNDSYFKIVKKRSIVFYYISVFILYFFLLHFVLLILNRDNSDFRSGIFN